MSKTGNVFEDAPKYYNSNQECPQCSKDGFLELKQFPGYGRCTECSFDNEVEVIDKLKQID